MHGTGNCKYGRLLVGKKMGPKEFLMERRKTSPKYRTVGNPTCASVPQHGTRPSSRRSNTGGARHLRGLTVDAWLARAS